MSGDLEAAHEAERTGVESHASLRWIWPVCAVLLLATNLFLMWKLHQPPTGFQRVTPRANWEGVRRVMDASLPSAADGPVTLAKTGARYVLLFVFTPSDCTYCVAELANLNQFAAAGSEREVEVAALMSYTDIEEARQVSQYYGLNYPVLVDKRGDALHLIGAPATPWKILIDASGKHVVYEDPTSETPAERDAFLSQVSSIIGK
jgi:peroxiredoxin